MFRDEAVLIASAGRGGDGCSSFHREKFTPRGGPDGGDGGDGGSVILRASVHESSLFRISRARHARAEHGRQGTSNNKHGRNGADLLIEVPVGTVVRDLRRGNVMADLKHEGSEVVVAAGGKGGRGNARFATAINQAPRRNDFGRDGEKRELQLELKLVADVGLVGLPNAGKSTLISRLTAARPRVAAYPFTTLEPALGFCETGGEPSALVLADIPGLIRGAADGKGLGHQFLRHVERTRVLLHLVDCSAEAEDPAAARAAIADELSAYAPELADRRRLLVATKVEDAASEARALELIAAAGGYGVAISAVTGAGLPALRRAMLGAVNAPVAAADPELPEATRHVGASEMGPDSRDPVREG